jgi:probable F420-dependent oxidoreductase
VAKVNVALRLPSVHNVDMEELRAFIVRAEELGFESIWVGDHVYHHVDVLQPLHMVSWIAALTRRVRLGTAVMLTSYLNPVLLAKALASIDYLSGGRLQVGISIGGTEAEYASIGVPINQRVGRLLENVAIMRALWAGDDVSYEGRYNQVTGGNIHPKPVQQHGVPLFFGANGEPMLRRAARHADGYVGSSGSGIGTFNQNVAYLRNEAREIGRDPDTLYVGKLQGVSVHTDAARARELAATQWQSYYSLRFDVDRATVHGTPEVVAERLREFTACEAPAVTAILEPPTLDRDLLALLYQTASQATSS